MVAQDGQDMGVGKGSSGPVVCLPTNLNLDRDRDLDPLSPLHSPPLCAFLPVFCAFYG